MSALTVTLNFKTAKQSSCLTLWPMMMYHHTNLVTEGSAVEEILSRWTFTGILNISCDLYLDNNRAIRSFHKTIQLLMICHQTKLSCKDQHLRRYIWKPYFDHMIRHCDPDLEVSKPIFLEDNLAHNDTSPHEVSANQKLLPGQTLTFCYDLDLENNIPFSL